MPPSYSLIDATGGLWYSDARDINASDEVVGAVQVGIADHPWISTQLGNPQVLPSPGGDGSFLAAINDRGDAVGTSQDRGVIHAILYQQGQLVDLNSDLGTSWSMATDINNDGVIVGVGGPDPTSQQAHGFIYDPRGGGSVVELGGLPGLSWSGANAINASGEVVGWSGDVNAQARPFLYRNGAMEELTGKTGSALDINDKGHVVGVSEDPISSPAASGPFLWVDGDIEPIPMNGVPMALNNQDQVVGQGFGASRQFAFYFSPSEGVLDLNPLIVESYGFYLAFAWNINEQGHITCAGVRDDEGYACVLIPDDGFHYHGELLELFLFILWGIIQDGGGLGRIGLKPVPVDPWGGLTHKQRERLEAKAITVIDGLTQNPEHRHQARREIHQILFDDSPAAGDP